MTLCLQMNGSSDNILTPTITYTQVVMDVLLNPLPSSETLGYVFDAQSRTTGGYIRLQSGGTWSNGGFTTINGNMVGARTTITGTLSTTQTMYSRIFSRSDGGSLTFISGNIYDIKFYNGATLVAHYDMSTGTVNDQTGNGYNATLTGGTWVNASSGTTYIGSGTATGKSNLTSNETLILKSNNTSNGISSLTTSEQLISHQGTTYSGSGSSNGISSSNTIESIINKSNGQSNSNSLLNTNETKSYSANGSVNSNSNVSSVGNVIYVDFANSQGQSSLSTTETFVQHGTTTYSAQGLSNGQATLTNNDALIFKSPSTVQGLSSLIDHVVEVLSANGNINGISSTTSTEQIIGHPTSIYSASGTTQGKANVSSTEYVVFEVVGKSDGTSQASSSEKVTYLPSGIANGLTSISTQEKYISTFEIIGTIELTSQLEINIYLIGVSELNINLKEVI